MDQDTACYIWWCGGEVVSATVCPARTRIELAIEHQMVATKSLQSWPLRPALKGAPMDVIYHSEIGTPHTMIEVMNHVKVLLKSTGRSDYNETGVSQRKSHIIPGNFTHRFGALKYHKTLLGLKRD